MTGAIVVIGSPAATSSSFAASRERRSARRVANGQARPHAEQRIAGVRTASDPDLIRELLDLDRPRAGERVGRGHAEDQLALGDRRQRERGRLGVRRAEGRREREHREVERSARSARVSAGVVPSRKVTLYVADSVASARGTSPAAAVAERAQPHRSGHERLARRLTAGGVELLQDADRPRQQARPRRRQDHAAAAALEQPAAGHGLERRDLP